MRIVLITLTIALFYALTTTVISITHRTFGDIIYSFVMTFGFILIPLFICVCIFHLFLNIYKWTKRQPTLIIQILTLWLVYNLSLFFVNLPDFIRHQNNQGYLHYKSFAEYFMTEMLEGFIIATIFSIAIPLLDNFFKDKIIKRHTSHKYKRT
jgi:hypothetical protein